MGKGEFVVVYSFLEMMEKLPSFEIVTNQKNIGFVFVHLIHFDNVPVIHFSHDRKFLYKGGLVH